MTELYYRIKIYPKGSHEKLGEFFNVAELRCRCQNIDCVSTIVSKDLIKCLDNLRLLAECPILITSAYRCPQHNSAIGGEMLSRHMSGEAADVLKPEHFTLDAFADLGLKAGFSFVKKYNNPERCHFDVR